MTLRVIWVLITALILGLAISAFIGGVWLLQITYNTLEYTERLNHRETIADEVELQLLLQRDIIYQP